jgi:threonylcarbamoyladenosine tRNA methylthiotransferase MtaB
MRVNLKTLGCRLNEAELETWAQAFQAKGHRIVAEPQEADLIVLNSCAVTADAVRKSRQLIRRMHRDNPRAKLVVSGCYATLDKQEVAASLGVDLVVTNADKSRLVDIAQRELALESMPALASEPGETALFSRRRQRAFIKVQDGCRYRCTFCIVTIVRGEERSRPLQDIVSEINRLHQQGIQEVVLTGVHLGGYGGDLHLSLDRLIQAVLEDTDIPRLRLGSLEPWELPESFFGLFQSERFMPHLHLPLQSGSDGVLRRMARRCKTADFASLVARARAEVPGINITTDVIVGFPGETEAEWSESVAFIEKMQFGHVHVFSYSMREGTKAARMPDQVPAHIKKRRSQMLHSVAKQLKRETYSRFLGQEFPVLWEEGDEDAGQGQLKQYGYTPNFLRVAAFVAPEDNLVNQIRTARLDTVAESGDCALVRLSSACGFQ